MTRRRQRGHSRDGLWTWGGEQGEITPAEVHANPLHVACAHPPCRAAVGSPCVDIHRKPRGPHPSRTEAAEAVIAARAAVAVQEGGGGASGGAVVSREGVGDGGRPGGCERPDLHV